MLTGVCKQTCQRHDYRYTHTLYDAEHGECRCYGLDDATVPAAAAFVGGTRYACPVTGPGSVGSPLERNGEYRVTDCRVLDTSTHAALREDVRARAGDVMVDPQRYACGESGDPGACLLRPQGGATASPGRAAADMGGVALPLSGDALASAGDGVGRVGMQTVADARAEAPLPRAAPPTRRAAPQAAREACLSTQRVTYGTGQGRFAPTPFTTGNSTNALTSVYRT